MLDFAHWMVQGRVLLVQFSGVLTLDDINQMNSQVIVLIQNALPPHVDLICDLTYITQFDSQLANIRKFKTIAIKYPHINWYISVRANSNPAMHFVATMVSSLIGVRYRGMKTVQEALAFLQASSNYDLTRTDIGE